jgi:hypothetical protein
LAIQEGFLLSKPKKKNPEVYLFWDEDFLTLELGLDHTVWYAVEDPPDFFTSVSAHQCQKCGQVQIVTSEADLDHSEQREMGPEYWYYIHEDLTCPRCGEQSIIDIIVTYYAFCWDIDSDNLGVKDVWIEGLDWLAQKYAELETTSAEKETLTLSLKNQAEEMLKRFNESKMYVLMVEGRDDIFVWEQFLKKHTIQADSVDIMKYGDGGLNEAMKGAEFFTGRKMGRIPHKLILDSDNDPDSILKALKKNGINKKHFHILKEKEIESYLLDYRAISTVLSIDLKEVEDFAQNLGQMEKRSLM